MLFTLIGKSNNLDMVSYLQTQTLTSIFYNEPTNNVWIKNNDTKILLDFIENKKIILLSDTSKPLYYSIKKIKLEKYDSVANVYTMKSVDNYNNKYNIQVVYYNDSNSLVTIYDKYKINRYKFINK